MADLHAILARLADGDPTLILPALAAAVVLLAAAGVADLFASDDSITARLATGVSRRDPTAPACRCGPRRRHDAAKASRFFARRRSSSGAAGHASH